LYSLKVTQVAHLFFERDGLGRRGGAGRVHLGPVSEFDVVALVRVLLVATLELELAGQSGGVVWCGRVQWWQPVEVDVDDGSGSRGAVAEGDAEEENAITPRDDQSAV